MTEGGNLLFVMLNLFQHNALRLVILKRVQDDDLGVSR
jgi:hypothetical protein